MPEAPTQLTKADLKVMSPEAIVDALKAGQLHTLLTTADAPPDPVAEAIVQDGRITDAATPQATFPNTRARESCLGRARSVDEGWSDSRRSGGDLGFQRGER